VCGVSGEALRKRLSRARAMLKKELRQELLIGPSLAPRLAHDH
jgi:DNA-directed RNA polymerase specialized sigma24 family protein